MRLLTCDRAPQTGLEGALCFCLKKINGWIFKYFIIYMQGYSNHIAIIHKILKTITLRIQKDQREGPVGKDTFNHN